MRAVWSFWTKPYEAHHRSAWLSDRHHLLAWVVSMKSGAAHYRPTCLVTDDAGARLLVDGLGLEFDVVSTALNALSDYDPGWWALGKIYTYRLQTEPFVHIDSDVFLWQRLPAQLERAALFAQNPERFTPGASYYRPELFELVLAGGWLPDEWRWYRAAGQGQSAICCGIVGGHRMDFLHHYAAQALRLIDHPANRPHWSRLSDKIGHNVLFEQYLLAACLQYHRDRPGSPFRDLDINYLFESSDSAYDPNNAARLGYSHLIAGAKRNTRLAQRLEQRVMRDYPKLYERCLRIAA